MSLSNFCARHGKKVLILTVIILLALAAVWLVIGRRVPPEVRQAQKTTDIAVRSAETTVLSADKAITKTYRTVRKKVTADNAAMQKRVKSLSGDAVAAELITLIDEYRRERDGGG